MKRLTKRVGYRSEAAPLEDMDDALALQKVIDRLAAYEDTGLSPEEILDPVEMAKVAMAIKENAHLRSRLADMTDVEKLAFQKALSTWGKEAQIAMVFEEMSELQKELCKHLRGKDTTQGIAEEIADVEIMLCQMKLLFGIESLVKERRGDKVTRLLERLEGKHE